MIEVIKQHRDLWIHYENTPELAGFFDPERDMNINPLTERETRFFGFVVNHIRATFYAKAAGIYVQPQRLKEDVRSLFSCSAVRAAWQISKQYHDDEFVVFIEKTVLADHSAGMSAFACVNVLRGIHTTRSSGPQETGAEAGLEIAP